MKYYDERNTLFSRVWLEKGTKEYEDYYKRNPEMQKEDDKYRRITFRNNLKKSDQFKSLFFPLNANNKKYIKSLHDLCDNQDIGKKQDIPEGFETNIKEITKYYGATNVGITTLDAYSYYSHFGGLNDALGISNYGEKPNQKYKSAIVFTIHMDLQQMNRAPHFEELLSTEEAYVKAAYVGARLAIYLKTIGYDAAFNSSEYYLGPVVPLAYDAGLGQIGMSNHLVTPREGDNVRIGAVFTTMELAPDKPIDFGLEAFCKRCALCLMNCPSHAIRHQQRIVNGRTWYKFDDIACFNMWTKMGTDCGTCIQSCPFTQGLSEEQLQRIKQGDLAIDKVMDEHMEKHGRRRYTKEELPIVKIGDKK